MALGFGDINPFPFEFGGGDSIVEQEHDALLRPFVGIFDTEPGSDLWVETYAEAVMLSTIWACNERLRGMHVPERMLEALPIWEQACGLKPEPNATPAERRAAVAAKFRGLAGNALGDIEETARAVLGQHFVSLEIVAPTNVVSYWPGVNPGPPGFEWSSNRAIVGIHMSRSGLDDSTFSLLRGRCAQALDDMLPAWMRFVIGVGTSFIVNQGIVGQTFI